MSRAAFYQSNLNSLEVELAEARSKIFQDKRVYFSRTVVLRYRIHLEQKNLAPLTINVRLAAVRRLAYEAADNGFLSPELAAGIRRVKGAKRLGVRIGNWLTRFCRSARSLKPRSPWRQSGWKVPPLLRRWNLRPVHLRISLSGRGHGLEAASSDPASYRPERDQIHRSSRLRPWSVRP